MTLRRRIASVCGCRGAWCSVLWFFFFQAEDGIRDLTVTGVQTCALPISDELSLWFGTHARNAAASRTTEAHFWRSAMSNSLASKLLAEFIGTFAFVFIGAGAAAVVGDGVGLPGITAIAFAHGLTIMAFASAYRPLSGGHMNPAVTVAPPPAGAMRAREAAGYIGIQLLAPFVGVIVGALVHTGLTGLARQPEMTAEAAQPVQTPAG